MIEPFDDLTVRSAYYVCRRVNGAEAFVSEVLSVLPWAGTLNARAFGRMVDEIRAEGVAFLQHHDPTPVQRVLQRWRRRAETHRPSWIAS